MKNKVLSYLCGGLLVINMCFMVGSVYADCDCPENDFGCQKACYYESQEYQENSTPEKGGGCGELPAGYICCDNEYPVSAEIGCAGVVVKGCKDGCCGIKLNTDFPIIGNCIGDSPDENETNAFPKMIGAITKIVMSLVFVVCFILIIYAGILWAADKPKDAKDWLKRVAITILLLGFSGAILRLINPNFFS